VTAEPVACIFCAIVAGQFPASFVYADETAMAFMDVNPVTPGHVLVVPRAHAIGLLDLDEETGAHLFRVAMRLRRGLRCEGVNLFLADGEAAFQEVFHVHLHVFPRFAGDAFKIDADWSNPPPRAELDEHAAAIRGALAPP
jgi:diadenosine tetraphosphate (Ap4A) HIT family hydrolase